MPTIQEHVPLASLTTIGIGGPASYFADATSVEELRGYLAWAHDKNLQALILGGGSNLLIADAGFSGLVIRTQFRGIEEEAPVGDSVQVRAAAGENWDAFVKYCVDRNYAGIECLSGIPGCVGASPIQNIGAYGQEVKDTIVRVEAVERTSGELHMFTNADMDFGYRMSRFKANDRDRFVVTSVTFRLAINGVPTLRYGDLTRYFESAGILQPTLQQVRKAILDVRARKAMVLDPHEPNSRSCGSFFMNPVVPTATYESILAQLDHEKLLGHGEKMPAFDAGQGFRKLSAAWLMERSGLRKGLRHGNVGLSEKHVLAIVNCGGGTAAEVLELVKLVRDSVFARFGVHLEPEPVFVGFK